MSNFAFLQAYWPDFANTLDFAEKYVYSDPASSKNKSGLFVELMVREIMRIENIPEPECKRKSRVDGEEWENERYTEKDSELLSKLGLIDKPIIILEPKKKAGRPKGSKDKKPRKKRFKSTSESATTGQ